jgi:hypothetical protein
MNHIEWLKKHGACEGGIAFASQYETLQEAWDACEIIDYLAWVSMTAAEIRATGKSWNESDDAWKGAPLGARSAWRETRDAADQAERVDLERGESVCDVFRGLIPCPEIGAE